MTSNLNPGAFVSARTTIIDIGSKVDFTSVGGIAIAVTKANIARSDLALSVGAGAGGMC